MQASEKPQKYKMLIGGEWVNAGNGDTSPVVNPANGRELARVPRAGLEDVKKAIDAARESFDKGVWSSKTPGERMSVLLKIADLVERDIDRLAMLETLNQGKPIKSARYFDFSFGVDNIRFFAGAARMLEGKPSMEFGGGTSIVRREPVGVVAGIAPWNFPWLMMVWKVIAPLATGNSVVFKPASVTPLTSLEFTKIIQDAGVPPGVLNVVTGVGGSEIGNELTSNPKVDMVTLTGDTETGKAVMRSASPTVKKVHLELGGKAPFVVFDDADVDAAVQGAMAGGYINCGQICIQATRMIVQEKVYDSFVNKLVEKSRRIIVGPGERWETDMGPMVSESQRDKVESLVQTGLNEGAKLVLGGARPKGALYDQGFYYQPTIFKDVDQSMIIAQKEIFGPVLGILKFSTTEDAIQMANDVVFGLWSSVWSKNIYTAMKVANALRFGSVMVNEHIGMFSETPHGGYKQSGSGKALSAYTVESYTNLKHVYVDLTGTVHRGWHDTVFGTSLKPKTD